MKPESIALKSILRLATLATLLFSSWAQAAAPVRCTITSGPISTAYGSLSNVTAGNFTVTCSNTGTATYYVGAIGTNLPVTRAVSGSSFILYNLFQDSACSIPWNNTTGLFAATVASPMTTGFNFYVCIPANQTGLTAGTYTDTVTVAFTAASTASPSNPATFSSTANISVSIVAPATCSITTPPGNITFNYTSFGAAANASATFAATCTNKLPYEMALDSTSGTIVGVNYMLGLSAIGGTGNGLPQTYNISGNIAAGQSGTCGAGACSGSKMHTLTITY